VPEAISNTSPLQYLHQTDLIDLLPALYGRVIVPVGVVTELAEGRARGVSLPDPTALAWMELRTVREPALLPLAADLGQGEREVLAIAKEVGDGLAILETHLPAGTRACSAFALRERSASFSKRNPPGVCHWWSPFSISSIPSASGSTPGHGLRC
jgi:hypothetical protein